MPFLFFESGGGRSRGAARIIAMPVRRRNAAVSISTLAFAAGAANAAIAALPPPALTPNIPLSLPRTRRQPLPPQKTTTNRPTQPTAKMAAPFAGVHEFLRANHLAPLLSADAKALQVLNKWTTAGTALQVLATANVLSCPVLDEDGEYFGCLSVNDLLRSLNAHLQAKDPEWCAPFCFLLCCWMDAAGAAAGLTLAAAAGRERDCVCADQAPKSPQLNNQPKHPLKHKTPPHYQSKPPKQPDDNNKNRTEKIDKMSAADLVALGREFCAQTVDKLQHAGDLWLLNADDASTLMDAVLESFRIQDQHVRGGRERETEEDCADGERVL